MTATKKSYNNFQKFVVGKIFFMFLREVSYAHLFDLFILHSKTVILLNIG